MNKAVLAIIFILAASLSGQVEDARRYSGNLAKVASKNGITGNGSKVRVILNCKTNTGITDWTKSVIRNPRASIDRRTGNLSLVFDTVDPINPADVMTYGSDSTMNNAHSLHLICYDANGKYVTKCRTPRWTGMYTTASVLRGFQRPELQDVAPGRGVDSWIAFKPRNNTLGWKLPLRDASSIAIIELSIGWVGDF